jgi:hypothetical protein
MSELSREDVDPYFFDPDGEIEVREYLREKGEDWEDYEQLREETE